MVPLFFRKATSTFRTRNRRRDMATDAARLARVRQAVDLAIIDIEREREGLQRRVDFYLAKASSLMDETGDFSNRTVEDETELRTAEQHISEARHRLGTLANEAVQFAKLLEMVDGVPRAEVA
jgi:hypothetical protein